MTKINGDFVKELGKTLRKFDVKALDDFINSHKEYYNDFLIDNWNRSALVIKEMTLCKMIIARTDMSLPLKIKASKRLDEIRANIANFKDA